MSLPLRRLVATVGLLLVSLMPGPAASAPAGDSDVAWVRGACAENIVLARLLDAHVNPPQGCILDPREYCRVEILESLRGSLHPGVVEGWFVGDAGSPSWSGPHHRSDVGKLVLLFPERTPFHTLMHVGPGLPGGGVVVLDGRADPALERMRLEIRKASLDSLMARAEAACFGGYRRGQATEFVVREWLFGEDPRKPLWVWHEEGQDAETGKVLMFLERDTRGRWRPVGNGAGELAVRRGRVVRFGRRLEDVFRDIRERRFDATRVTILQ